MKRINKIGAGLAIVSAATIFCGVGKIIYDGFSVNSYSNQVRLLEHYSEKPDQAKLGELRQGALDAGKDFMRDTWLTIGMFVPYVTGLGMNIHRPMRKEETGIDEVVV